MRWILIALLLLAAACSSKPAPAWQSAAHTQLHNFTLAYLEGDDKTAELHFEKALEHIKKTGDPALLGRAWLTKCALQRASLEDTPCLLESGAADPQNQAYLSMLNGETADSSKLPEHYRDILKAAYEGRDAKIAEELADMDDPISALIAAAVIYKKGSAGDAVLEQAVRIASENGCKKPLRAFLLALKARYESAGETEKLRVIEERLTILK